MTSMKQKTIMLLENIISKGAVTSCDLSLNYSYSIDWIHRLLSLHFIRQHDLVQPKLHNRRSTKNMRVYTITKDGAFYLFNELNKQRLEDEIKDDIRQG
jgi:hypothetical protein